MVEPWVGLHFNWTDERIKRLKQLWDEGYSGTYIAIELGAPSRNSCIGKIHRLGLQKREYGHRGPDNRRVPRPSIAMPADQRKILNGIKRALKEKIVKPLPEQRIEKPATVSFMELGHGKCKYIPGIPTYDAMCCGDPVIVGSSYCQFHSEICHTTIPHRNRAAS